MFFDLHKTYLSFESFILKITDNNLYSTSCITWESTFKMLVICSKEILE